MLNVLYLMFTEVVVQNDPDSESDTEAAEQMTATRTVTCEY